jgi:hypothetical protein
MSAGQCAARAHGSERLELDGMAERLSDRELHERVADALAALRFYRTYYSSAGVGADRIINDPRPKGRGIQNSASWRSSWSFR